VPAQAFRVQAVEVVRSQIAVTSPVSQDVISNDQEIVIWLAGLGVLAANVLLLRQNRSLQDALAPQIAAGAHLDKLAGLTLDGRLQPLARRGGKNVEANWESTSGCGVRSGHGGEWLNGPRRDGMQVLPLRRGQNPPGCGGMSFRPEGAAVCQR
jgi:hypothetical protein